MTQPPSPSSPPPVYEVFFTGKDDPRDGCIVIGEDTKPIFYRFETPPSYVGNPRTTVSLFFFLFIAGPSDLIYPLLDNLSIPPPHSRPFPSTILPLSQGLSECRRDRRLYGLDRAYGLSARTPHDRQPSITHDPVCDAWIDRKVRPGFRLFGPYLPFPPIHLFPNLIRTCSLFSPSQSSFCSRSRPSLHFLSPG